MVFLDLRVGRLRCGSGLGLCVCVHSISLAAGYMAYIITYALSVLAIVPLPRILNACHLPCHTLRLLALDTLPLHGGNMVRLVRV